MTNLDPKVVARIHKLLALARDGGATEAEAETAMRMAQQAMLDHNLSMATIEAAGGAAAEGRTRDTTDKNLMYPWKREFLQAIAKVNFVYVSLIDKRTKSGQWIGGGYELIGRISNVVATRNMFEYLLQTIERLVVADVGVSPQARYTKYAHSFRLGAATRLQERLSLRHHEQMEAQRQAAEERNASPAVNALVVLMEDYEQAEEDFNNDLRNGWEPGTTARRREESDRAYKVRQTEFARKKAEYMARGETEDMANYLANGVSRETAAKWCEPPKEKTEKQRAKEERANRRYWDQYRAREERKNAKIDWYAHGKGGQAADDVSLDQQIDRDHRRLK